MIKIVKHCPYCECLFICSNKSEGCKEARQCVCYDCLSFDRKGCNIQVIRSGVRLKEDTS